MRHYNRPYKPAILARSHPDMSRERELEAKQREGDRRLQRALAEAFVRGDHLPAGTVVSLRLIG